MTLRRIAVLVGVTAVYFGAGKLGLSLAFEHASASAVWPPTGIALAALLLFGQPVWPAILVGAFLVNITTSGDTLSSIGIAVGNTLEGVTGAWLVHRVVGGPAALNRAEGVFKFAGLAAPIAAVVSATFGVASLALAGLAAPSALGSIWMTWWLGDTAGAVVVAPLALLWGAHARLEWSPQKGVEAALLLATLALTVLVVFRGLFPPIARGYPLAFLLVPVLLWAAFRFGQRETVTASVLLSGFAVWGTLDGFGPFAILTPDRSLMVLQAFIGVMMVAMLAASAEVANRRAAEEELTRLNEELEARVTARTEELQRAQARLVDAQEVAHIGSWEWDISANMVWCSGELYQIYGLGPAGLSTSYEGFLRAVHPEDKALVEAAVRQALDGRAPFGIDHRLVRADGSVRVVHARGRVIADAQGRPLRMLGTGQDITDRRRAEEERAQLAQEQAARREAEEASRAKDQFLALLSHELRTPVNAVLWWADLLVHRKLDEATTAKALSAIHRNSVIQTQLVSDILDAARIRAGTMRLKLESMDLVAAIDGAVDSIKPTAVAKNIEIVTDLAPAHITGDPRRIGQVVSNLLSNSVKFAASNSRILIGSKRRGPHVEIIVEDEGPGISPEFMPDLFKQFRQADPSTTKEHQGLGLGLAIVRQIVTLHGGTVGAANRLGGRGAIFTVLLPVSGSAAPDHAGAERDLVNL